MADLQALYQENGLQGILPYAFGMEGQGYRFLCQKMKEGFPFWVICANTNKMPFYSFADEKIFFSLYSEKSLAIKKCDELAMDKFYTSPALLDVAGWADRLWKRYRDLGVSHIRFDDAVWVNVKDLVPPATYEGLLNVETPLKNPTLNAAMYTMLQCMDAEACSDALIAYFWNTLKESLFYAPIRLTGQLKSGESVNAENSDFHFLTTDEGQKVVLLFTDGDFKEIYGDIFQVPPSDNQIVYAPTWSDVREYLDAHSELAAMINAGAGNLILTQGHIHAYETIALNQSALEANGAVSLAPDEQPFEKPSPNQL